MIKDIIEVNLNWIHISNLTILNDLVRWIKLSHATNKEKIESLDLMVEYVF